MLKGIWRTFRKHFDHFAFSLWVDLKGQRALYRLGRGDWSEKITPAHPPDILEE